MLKLCGLQIITQSCTIRQQVTSALEQQNGIHKYTITPEMTFAFFSPLSYSLLSNFSYFTHSKFIITFTAKESDVIATYIHGRE
jgi:hypothetical protein